MTNDTNDNEQLIVEGEADDMAETLKTCYYCGKKIRLDAPRCETCGNDRSFTWTGKG